MCPSFAFGNDGTHLSVSFGPNQGMVRNPNITITRGKITSDGARGLNVLALHLGPMAHLVPCLLGLTRAKKPNIIITWGKITF